MPHKEENDSSPIVYLIRHGEKPPKQPDGKDAVGLSCLGLERAKALVQVFGESSHYNIRFIIAQHPEPDGEEARPFETIQPLAESLGSKVELNTEIGRDQPKCVADAIHKYNGPGNILVCWEHEHLKKIAKAIGVIDPIPYPGDRYDLIWTVSPPYDQINSITSEHCPGIDDAYANEP